MKISNRSLLAELKNKTQNVLNEAELFLELSNEELNFKQSPESWSILECLEHLNLYGRFYIKEIERAMSNDKSSPSSTFKSGWLGNYFANSMKPNPNMKKMKTFTNMNPVNSILDKSVIHEFINQQKKMLSLLEKAETKNLSKIKCGITITKLLKLRLGDTFRFVIYHNERHMAQAKRAIIAYGKQQIPQNIAVVNV